MQSEFISRIVLPCDISEMRPLFNQSDLDMEGRTDATGLDCSFGLPLSQKTAKKGQQIAALRITLNALAEETEPPYNHN
jgi:hypothetical protein